MENDEMEIQDYSLEPIVEYKLDPVQAKAYKVMILWLVTSRKVFPDFKMALNRMPKGDPRKSHLWKVCFKAVRMLDGKLKDEDLRLYVTAQLHVMRAITDGEAHPNVTPEIMCSQKSWARWCVWKKKYEATVAARSVDTAKIENPADPALTEDLEKAKKFLERIFRRQPTYDDIEIAVTDRSLIRWTKLKKISPLYAALSPWVRKALNGVNLQLYLQVDLAGVKVTPALEDQFRKVFPHEQ
jgi:hypothetical protein